MITIRRRCGLVALLAFEVTAVATFHQLGRLEWLQIRWADLGTWLDTVLVEDLLAAVLRLVALVLAYWLLGTTVVYLVARLAQVPAALRAIDWATLPAVRRVVDGAVAVSIATATIAAPIGPALADRPPPVVVEVDEQGRPVPPGPPTADSAQEERAPDNEPAGSVLPIGPVRAGWTPTPAGGDTARPPAAIRDTFDAVRNALRAEQMATSTTGPTAVVVQPGDHLWAISRTHLEASTAAVVSNDTVAVYWRRVIAANRDRLRSGDPDLIFPGEAIVLPPIDREDR